MKKLFIVLVSLLCVASSVFAVSVADLEGVPNIMELETDVFSGGRPSLEALESAARNGIRTVIDLRTPEEGTLEEKEVVEKLGMAYFNIPVTTETLSLTQAEQVVDILSDEKSKPVLLHCGSGNRVGAIWALYHKLKYQADAETALDIGLSSGLKSMHLTNKTRDLLKS